MTFKEDSCSDDGDDAGPRSSFGTRCGCRVIKAPAAINRWMLFREEEVHKNEQEMCTAEENMTVKQHLLTDVYNICPGPQIKI